MKNLDLFRTLTFRYRTDGYIPTDSFLEFVTESIQLQMPETDYLNASLARKRFQHRTREIVYEATEGRKEMSES